MAKTTKRVSKDTSLVMFTQVLNTSVRVFGVNKDFKYIVGKDLPVQIGFPTLGKVLCTMRINSVESPTLITNISDQESSVCETDLVIEQDAQKGETND